MKKTSFYCDICKKLIPPEEIHYALAVVCDNHLLSVSPCPPTVDACGATCIMSWLNKEGAKERFKVSKILGHPRQ